MTVYEIVHSVVDIALGSGVLYALLAKRARRHRALTSFAPRPERTPGHDVEIWKGEGAEAVFVGVRPEGHKDIDDALRTKGLYVRWPDGSVQERP